MSSGFRALDQTMALAGMDPMGRLQLLLGVGCPAQAALALVCRRLPPEPAPPGRTRRGTGGTPWHLVRFAGLCVREGLITLPQAEDLLQGYRIHPWSLLWCASALAPALAGAWGEALRVPPGVPALAASWGEGADLDLFFALHGDPALEELPEGFKVHTLSLRDCPRLAAIGPGLEAEGILELINCGLLTTLPEGLRVLHHVRITGCSSFGRMPAAFSCGGLQLDDLPLLERLCLPSNFSGFLQARDCRTLGALKVWQALEHLQLARCALPELPEGMWIQDDLDLRELPLERLPANLRVGGACHLLDLPRCGALGAGTHIAGDLVLSGLPALRSIPPDLVVEGRVLLDPDLDPGLLPASLRDRLAAWEGRP